MKVHAHNRNKGLHYTLRHRWDRPLGVSRTSVRAPEDEHKESAQNVVVYIRHKSLFI